MTTYLACMGTRPEIIKMAPIYRCLKERGETIEVLHTGQHEDVAQALYEFFDMDPDYQIQLKRRVPSLSNLTAELLQGIDGVISTAKPDVMLVQGDTATAFVGAMASYYRNIPVAHIEAGLRTGQHDPFPEEKNREMIGRLANWHFPPTSQATKNLLREGVAQAQIFEVGNTVIDAALWVREHIQQAQSANPLPAGVQNFMAKHSCSRLMLVTAHRRENWGQPIQQIAAAVGHLLQLHPELTVVWPMHPNPSVRSDVEQSFEKLAPYSRERLCLTEPLEYPALISMLAHCYFCLTDSGGIQEEASALQRPVLITRDSTERQELVDAGGAILVGTDPQRILTQAHRLLQNNGAYQAMQLQQSPFGDGHSAERIADILSLAHIKH